MAIKQETLNITRTFKHSPARVFRAFTKVDELAKWAPPDESMNMRIESGSCETGSQLVWSCGPGEAEGIKVHSDYFHAEQDTELLFSEAISMQGHLLSVALVSVELSGDDSHTDLKLNVQVSAIDPDMLTDYAGGWTQALGNLETLLG